MVKNGDLIDVEPDGTITVDGKSINGVEANPTREATQTLEKIKIGDVAYNVGGGGGGGSDYTAGSNIEINEAKEISVNPIMTGLESISLKDSGGQKNIIYTESGGIIKVRTSSTLTKYPKFRLVNYNYLNNRELTISFDCDPNYAETILIRGQKINGTSYVFLTKGASVPFVPSGDGTYVLKATVSGGAVTYTWVAE